MSHFSKVKTKCSNKEAIKRALKRLFPDNAVQEDSLVQGWMQNTMKADIVLKAPEGMHYDVGFQKQGDGTYSAVSDFSMGSWMGRQKEFTNKFNQAYGVEAAKMQAEEMGAFVQEEVQQDGTVRLFIQEF